MRNDCLSSRETAVLDVDTARQRLLAQVRTIEESEHTPLRSALGRVLTHDIRAGRNVPPCDNAAMDGYALRGADLPAGAPRHFKITATLLAGASPARAPGENECVRIMTGAALPPGADTVVMQEDTVRDGDRVIIGPGHRRGQHVRRAGEDIARDSVALAAGKRLSPADLGVLASLGAITVEVKRLPRIALFSTGDELREPGESLPPGCIHDSNRYAIHALLEQLGLKAVDLGIIADTREAIAEAMRQAARGGADAILSSGGVSVGEADFVKDMLAETGRIDFWKVNMKPGRPFAFGRTGGAYFFGLPGNPVSALVSFHQFVQPALRRLMGEHPAPPLTFAARCLSPLKKTPGRREFQRGILETDEQGETTVRGTGAQGSGILRSMSQANCFIILPEECGGVEAGALVTVQPFPAL